MSLEITKDSEGSNRAINEAARPLIEIKNLKKYFPVTEGIVIQNTVAEVKAIDDISFKILTQIWRDFDISHPNGVRTRAKHRYGCYK